MNIYDEIRTWASLRGIYQSGDVKTQFVKLQEESGELAKSIIKNDKEEFIDAIGDCVVVLTNLAKLGSNHFDDETISIENCLISAYSEIKNRKGEMKNGSFVKD